MAERYIKMFTIPSSLYAENAPVVILAGALLKDNQTGKTLVQLKIQNLDWISVTYLKLRFDLFDTNGLPLETGFEYEYNNISISENDYFGPKNPIVLPQGGVFSFCVSIEEVRFFNGSAWISSSTWELLLDSEDIDTVRNRYQSYIDNIRRQEEEARQKEAAERKRIAEEEQKKKEAIEAAKRKRRNKRILLSLPVIFILLIALFIFNANQNQKKIEILSKELVGTSWTEYFSIRNTQFIYSFDDDTTGTYSIKDNAGLNHSSKFEWKITGISGNTITVLIDYDGEGENGTLKLCFKQVGGEFEIVGIAD